MGRRKKIVDQCVRLMDKPEQIRNIAIAAHVDHGKCITGDARVSLADGRIVEASELFDRVKTNGEPTTETDGDAYVPTDEYEVATFDRERNEMTTASIDYAVKRQTDGPLIEVSTSNGHRLATTPEHRYLTLSRTGVMEFQRADELEPGDVIVGARKVPATGGQRATETELLRTLAATTDVAVTVDSQFREQVGRFEASTPDGSAGQSESFADAVGKEWVPLGDAVTWCDDNGVELTTLYDGIDRLTVPPEDGHDGEAPSGIRLPADLEPVFYLAGAAVAEWDGRPGITTDDPEFRTIVADRASALGVETRVIDRPDGETVTEVGDSTLRAVLAAILEDHGSEADSKVCSSELIFGAERDERAAYVRGMLDALGTIPTAGDGVTVSAPRPTVLSALQILLYQFDVASTLDRSRSTLTIRGTLSLANVAAIGFAIPHKQEQFAAFLEDSESALVDRVPVAGEILRAIRDDIGIEKNAVFPSYPAYEADERPLTKRALRRIVDQFSDRNHTDIRLDRLRSLTKADTSFVEVTAIQQRQQAHVYDFGVSDHHNFVAEGIVVHNTTLTDNLLAGAGMIADESAGEQLAMDTEEDEQERGITIDAANVSMTHEFEGDDHLINLIDTPGHVDFGGDVTRAMRAVDGALVVVDAVEGAMPQTETVLRQALREGVKPTLFINKVDRLISELQEGPEEMQERLMGVIRDVNDLIRGMTEEMDDIDEDWTVAVEDGTVAFGSALYLWGVSVRSMQRTGMDFGDIIELERADERRELHDRTPLSDVVLDMVCEHFPNPLDAQPHRIPRIWRGDADSDIAKRMREVDDDGEVVFMVTDIGMDPHAGEIATGRVFSGTLEKGQELNVSGTVGTNRLQSVGLFMGGEREEVERVPAGNIAAVTGLKDAVAGSTVSSMEMTPFESVEHISEPVITKSVEAQNMDDLPKLIETLRQVSKEDPTIQVDINEDTGEHLISGQGELHLEVQTQRIERNQGIPVNTGEPIVVYRETVTDSSDVVEGISPNRHNRFYLSVEPLGAAVVEAIRMGEVSMDIPEQERREALQEAGMDKDTSQNIEHIHGTNVLVDDTKGIQHLNETMELVVEGFDEAIEDGPLAAEPVQGALVRLRDARLHEDTIHRGPAQVIPAVRHALHDALIDAEVRLMEPMQDVRIDVPNEYMGAASGEIQGRRGRVDDMYQEGDLMVVEGVAPVEEMIGFSSDIRSATEGRASWNTENAGFQVMADNLQPDKIMEIRERKGMKLELPETVDYF